MFEKLVLFGAYIIAFFILYIMLPGLLFKRNKDTYLFGFFSNFIRMNFLVITVGYFLVTLKLFESAAIIIMFILFAGRKKLYLMLRPHKQKDSPNELYLWFYDYVDGLIQLPKLVKSRIFEKIKACKSYVSKISKTDIVNLFTMLFIFSYSAYIRFYDAFANAAPAMSDAYVTLAWIKYIGKRILFHDGIYPQGFHLHQAMIQKVSSIDPLYVLKFTGPLSGFLIVLSIYFFVSRILKNKTAGMISAAIYGIFGLYLTGSLERQTATNAQEYAFVFVYPCLYFYYKYLNNKNKNDLYLAATAFAVTGLIHSLAFLYAGLGILVLLISRYLTEKDNFFKAFKNVLIYACAATVVSLVPVGIGLLAGGKFHTSSLEFAVSEALDINFPFLIKTDYLTIFALGILFIYILINRKRKDTFGMTFIFLFGLASVCLYYFGGFITNSLVILSRARELYSLAVPVTLGACFYCLINVLAPKKETGFFVAFVTVLFITCISIILLPPVIIPYKMESNASVEQYIKISKNYRATEWLIVSQEEGYALSLGKGWHLMTGDFLKEYDPLEDDLIGNGETVPKLNVPHIFIYIESRPYETYTIMPELKDAYDRRVKEAVLLEKWITDYTSVNGSPQVFYKDEQLTVYYIYQPYAQTELSERVLGPKIK